MPEVSFDEAAELAYFGAKVLHPATIKPAVERGIPVRILNSLNPQRPGHAHRGDGRRGRAGEPRAIAFKKGISVILIAQPRMLMAYGFVARVFEVFDRHRTPVDLIATSEVSISLTVDDPHGRAARSRTELAAPGRGEGPRGHGHRERGRPRLRAATPAWPARDLPGPARRERGDDLVRGLGRERLVRGGGGRRGARGARCCTASSSRERRDR